jgi:hypothetical protein
MQTIRWRTLRPYPRVLSRPFRENEIDLAVIGD